MLLLLLPIVIQIILTNLRIKKKIKLPIFVTFIISVVLGIILSIVSTFVSASSYSDPHSTQVQCANGSISFLFVGLIVICIIMPTIGIIGSIRMHHRQHTI